MARKSSAVPVMEDNWRAESDHRTLKDAEEIKSDRGRMSGVKRHHAKQMKAMSALGKSMGRGK